MLSSPPFQLRKKKRKKPHIPWILFLRPTYKFPPMPRFQTPFTYTFTSALENKRTKKEKKQLKTKEKLDCEKKNTLQLKPTFILAIFGCCIFIFMTFCML